MVNYAVAYIFIKFIQIFNHDSKNISNRNLKFSPIIKNKVDSIEWIKLSKNVDYF